MRIALCIFRYFPFGGLQHDLLKIAQACLEHGHDVTIYTTRWEGENHLNITVKRIKVSAWSNHRRVKQFAQRLQPFFPHHDVVIGFEKIPNLDFYFAGDICFKLPRQKKNLFYRLNQRYRDYCALEKAVFSPSSSTQILSLTPTQQSYIDCYQTDSQRFHFIPPSVARNNLSSSEMATIRQQLRTSLAIPTTEVVLLLVASRFKTKGLDRIIHALPLLSNYSLRLWVVGADDSDHYNRLAQQLGVASSIQFFGGQKKVSHYMLAADVLVNPARAEAAGISLIEAITFGLPIIATANCGYSFHVTAAQAGIVLSQQPSHQELAQALQQMVDKNYRQQCHNNALNYAQHTNLYDMADSVLKIIEPYRRDTLDINRWHNKLIKNNDPRFDFFMSRQGQVYRQMAGRCTLKFCYQQRDYFIKQHFGVGWREIIKNLLQLRLPVISAKNEWLTIQQLQKIGIATITVLAHGQRYHNPAKRQSFLCSQPLLNCISLEDLCVQWQPSFHEKRMMIHRVATVSRQIHGAGINHRDYYLCHLWWHERQQQLYVMDLHRAQIRRQVPKRWLVKDLAGLYFSSLDIDLTANDIRYFLTIYFNLSWQQVIRKYRSLLVMTDTRARKLYLKTHQREARWLKL